MFEDNNLFSISKQGENLLFRWKNISSVSEKEYKHALGRIAHLCVEQQSKNILLDKRIFRPNIPLPKEWHIQNVIPAYRKAKIELLAHITGNVKGYRIISSFNEIEFLNIEFESLEEARLWIDSKK